MGGILNQNGNDKFEHDAHVIAHTPSKSKRDPYKRGSYPPHPAIVGAGPGSPYNARGGMQARDDTSGGDYFSSGGRQGRPASISKGASDGGYVAPVPIVPERTAHVPERAVYAERAGYDRTSYPAYPSRNGNAGVGARYLGGGRYEEDEYDSLDDDDDDDVDGERRYSGREEEKSQDSFVPPKPKKKWQIWR